MITISEAEINKRVAFQNVLIHLYFIGSGIIAVALIDNLLAVFIISLNIGIFVKDFVNYILQYRGWKRLISEYNKLQTDIKAFKN